MLFKINNSYQLDVKSRGRNKVKSWGGRVINIKQSDLVHEPNPFEELTLGLSYFLFKNRLRGSKPSAVAWETSLLWYKRTTESKYSPEIYDCYIGEGEYYCSIEEKTRCNGTFTKCRDFIAAEMLLLK